MNSISLGGCLVFQGFSLLFLRIASGVSVRQRGPSAVVWILVGYIVRRQASLVPGYVLVLKKVYPVIPRPSQTFLLSWTISILAGTIHLMSGYILHPVPEFGCLFPRPPQPRLCGRIYSTLTKSRWRSTRPDGKDQLALSSVMLCIPVSYVETC